MTKIAKKIAFYLVLGALLVSPLILAELILRQIGLGEPVLYETNAAYRYAPRPDQRMQRRRDAWITINESGLRSTEAWRGAAGTKILFVGDSVTWSGTNIDDSGTFPERVCALIESETGEDAVCGNAGVNGYGVDNMVKRLRYGGFADADAIVAVVLPGDLKRAEARLAAAEAAAAKVKAQSEAAAAAARQAAEEKKALAEAALEKPPPEPVQEPKGAIAVATVETEVFDEAPDTPGARLIAAIPRPPPVRRTRLPATENGWHG